MGIETAIMGGAQILGGIMGGDAAGKAADAQAAAANRAADLQKQMFNQQQANMQPYMNGGYAANNQLLQLLGIGGDKNAANYGSQGGTFNMQNFAADPGYQFRLDQGLKSLDRTAAARGGLISGGALKAAQGYGQDMASQEYQNAFNRYQTSRSNILNPLMGVAEQGLGATQNVGQAAQNYAGQAGNDYMGAGNAQASGYIGQANAWKNALGGIVNNQQQNSLLTRLGYPGGP